MSTIKELQANATLCRKRAQTKTGSAYEREITRAQEYEAQVRARCAALNWPHNHNLDEPDILNSDLKVDI